MNRAENRHPGRLAGSIQGKPQGHGMNVITDQDYCSFYRFWKYEFAKRNPQFLHAISTVFSTQDAEEKRRLRRDLERWGFGTAGWIGYYVDNARRMTNVLSIIENNAEIPYPDNPLFAVESISVLEYSGGLHDYESLRFGRIPPYTGICKVNFSLPFENLVQRLRKKYDSYHGDEKPDASLRLDLHNRSNDEALKFERMAIANRKNVSFEVDHLPRAVGLWLYDFIVHRFCDNIMRGAYKFSYNEVRNRFKVVSDRYGASEPETFRKLLARTKACIANVEVMTLH
jgi:hypothetical protein